jgi:hypothetical protein
MGFKKKCIIVLLIFAPLFTTYSCRTSNIDKKEREIMRERKKRKKDDYVLYQKALKRHMKIQSKETRKRMKEDLRRAKRNREHKKEIFFKRWFRKWFGYKQKPQKG